MYDLSGEMTVILTAVWWLQTLGKFGGQRKETRKLDVAIFNIRKIVNWRLVHIIRLSFQRDFQLSRT
jgi:hypothetical protein